MLCLFFLFSLKSSNQTHLINFFRVKVLKDLPPKIIQDYYCDMSALQLELYHDFAKKASVSDNIKKSLGLVEDEEEETGARSETEHEPPAEKGEHVFQALQYLRKVVNHPALALTPDHPKWSKLTGDSANANINEVRHSGKLLALRDLLNECGIGCSTGGNGDESTFNSDDLLINQHRVLIFCQLKSMIDIIERELLRKTMPNVSFLRLDGTVPVHDRFSVVRKFNSDPSIDLLLLTTQIGGLGLNLTGADTVIFVEHDWNPQKDLQAMDRAHRIGQTKVVNVYRLITKQTIEEKIMSLQRFKLSIANSVVNMDNSSLNSMGTEQLMNMFNRENSVAGAANTSSADSGKATSVEGGQYQKILDNITEIWDENQYESEYDMNAFIKSLK
jgi:TATA-binding protein-associated factor